MVNMFHDMLQIFPPVYHLIPNFLSIFWCIDFFFFLKSDLSILSFMPSAWERYPNDISMFTFSGTSVYFACLH